MSVKALMVDVDGVLAIQPDGRRWDADMQADLGIPSGDLQKHFFDPRFRACVLGKADLRDELREALPLFAPHVTAAT